MELIFVEKISCQCHPKFCTSTSTFMHIQLMMNNLLDHLALLQALNQQIDKQWDEELLPSIMCSLYTSVVVLLDDLVDDNPQQHRELMEMKKLLHLHTRRPQGPRQRSFNHVSIGISLVPFPSSLETSFPTFSGSVGSDSSS